MTKIHPPGSRALTFQQAAAVLMPFGKHMGQSLDTIAETDRGLLYLDWIAGQRRAVRGPLMDAMPEIDRALIVYLEDKTIAAAVDALVRR